MNEIMKCSIAETARPAVVEKLRSKLRDDAYPKKRPDIAQFFPQSGNFLLRPRCVTHHVCKIV